jgi:hypothetical protein
MPRLRYHRRLATVLTLTALAFTLAATGAQPRAAAVAPAELQVVSDTAGGQTGDLIGFHLLFHNAPASALPQAWVRVMLPVGLRPEQVEEADYDPFTRSIVWKLADLPADAAVVKHFQLRVSEEARPGADMALKARLETDAAVAAAPAELTVRVAPTQVQPFFHGDPDGRFRPADFITRAEMATVVSRVLQLPDPDPAFDPPVPTFADVPPSHWAHGDIGKVVAAGFMAGGTDGFLPDLLISRAEMVTLLLRFRHVAAFPFPSFADTAGHWARDAIGTARVLGWVEGTEAGNFAANLPVERQEAAKLLAVALSRRPAEGSLSQGEQHYADVPRSLWSFGWIEMVSVPGRPQA